MSTTDTPVDEPPDDAANNDATSWYETYKRHERTAGREPMSWGTWIQAGMPTPIEGS
jgi:hypothetical protein